jgi:hypothetical protein
MLKSLASRLVSETIYNHLYLVLPPNGFTREAPQANDFILEIEERAILLFANRLLEAVTANKKF